MKRDTKISEFVPTGGWCLDLLNRTSITIINNIGNNILLSACYILYAGEIFYYNNIISIINIIRNLKSFIYEN